jgi:hypothetical protein
MPEPLVEVTRGDLIESVHRGHIVVADEATTLSPHASLQPQKGNGRRGETLLPSGRLTDY